MPRKDRLDSLLKKEISQVIQFDLNDPKVGFATVSDVKIAPDLSSAKVYVSFLGRTNAKRDGIEALKRSKGYIKTRLAKALNIRKIPDLEFVLDDSLEKAFHLEEVIKKANDNNH